MSVDKMNDKGEMVSVGSTGGLGDWQAQCDALIAETRKHCALPSDPCVILALAAQTLLARRALSRLTDIRELLDAYEREHLAPRNLKFEGMILPRVVELARGQTSSPNIRDEPRAKRVGSGPWLGASGASTTQDAEPTQQANDHP